MSEKALQAVLEQVLTAAIDGALDARKKAGSDKFELGRMMAYYDVITWAKEQADLMDIAFGDRTLATFDPDKELLGGGKRAA